LLKSGSVQLYHLSADGRKLIMATVEPGACFGELPLTGNNLHQSFAEAVEDALVYTMNRGEVEHLLADKPAALLTLLQMSGQRGTQLEMQLVDTTFKNTNARLATLLLQLARPEQANGSTELVVSGFSQGELADRLGVYRETVALALRELKESGAIELGRKHITICRPALLQEQAAGQ
jgi:CRP-like cAMP-binding protein